MNIKENQTKQKLMGAYYTPDEIVDFMLRWTIESDKPQMILEPSAGDGQFLRRIKEVNRETQITAIEINEEESKNKKKMQEPCIYLTRLNQLIKNKRGMDK